MDLNDINEDEDVFIGCTSGDSPNIFCDSQMVHKSSMLCDSFQRQDSLALCEELQQEQDLKFMDEDIDLTPYLQDLNSANVCVDPFSKKHDIFVQNNFFLDDPHYSSLIDKDEETLSVTDLEQNSSPNAKWHPIPVKIEVDDDLICSTEKPTTSGIANEIKEEILVPYTPVIKPRKYSLKPEAERKNVQYRLKREKNNDAVRKSRKKAKQQQKLREEQIRQLQNRVSQLEKLVNEKSALIKQQETRMKSIIEEKNKLSTELESYKSQLTNVRRRSK